jgi:hypothetical protein
MHGATTDVSLCSLTSVSKSLWYFFRRLRKKTARNYLRPQRRALITAHCAVAMTHSLHHHHVDVVNQRPTQVVVLSQSSTHEHRRPVSHNKQTTTKKKLRNVTADCCALPFYPPTSRLNREWDGCKRCVTPLLTLVSKLPTTAAHLRCSRK